MNWSSFKTYGALTLVSLLYGINYNVLKIVVPEYVGPFGFIVFRVVIATAVFWLFYYFIREKINWKEDGWRLFLCSVSGIAVNQLLFYKGISLTSAVNGSIIMTLTPILTLVWAATLLGEKITRKKIVGILLGLIGAVVIIYKPASIETSGDWRGDV
ncbi:MAG: DMT family transporter, partial [Cyclobacteriaceae bacterium]